jgi:bifunctional non-homologous end joining protein LigD
MSAVPLRSSRPLSVSRVPGARKAGFPDYIEPCDPTLRERPPTGAGWLYEIKADGYRAQLRVHHRETTVFSRTGLDWTEQFSSIATAAPVLNASSAVIDGEAVVYGTKGLPDFQQLRRELGARKSERVRYHAFDLMYLDGYDLRGTPYIERKRLLANLLKSAPDTFVYVEHIEADGEQVFRNACELGLEGLVAKRADAPYRSGRQESWIKLKCKKSDTFPIVAFVEKLGASPRKIASLYVGRCEHKKLVYAGKVRTGYTEASARELRERLDPLIRRTTPLSVAVKKPKATWVEPDVKAEVEYGALTDDGLLREAVFKGMRDDLELPEVRAPRLAPSSTDRPRIGVPRENILQLLPDAVTPSKDELAAYWTRVCNKALPHLGHRPLKLVRHVHGTTFYHKGNLPKNIPEAVHRLRIEKREGGAGTRLWVDSLEGLLGLVEIGAVELHPWNAKVEDFEQADRLVIDLDPGLGVQWEELVETALRVRELMHAEGFATWPKLTGGKGIHVMAPFERPVAHDEAHRIARRVVSTIAARFPDRYILSAQAKRRGRIFLDYLRNGRGTTAIGTYSPRAREGFPIAAPVTWARIEAGIHPDAFTMTAPFRARRLTEKKVSG